MKTTKSTLRAATIALLLAAACGAYVTACGDGAGDTGTTGNPEPVGSSSSGGTTTTGGTGGAGGSSSTTTTGTGGTGGCFSGTPATDQQFLDACNGLTCNAFDNKGRLPLLGADGSLPALP